MISRWQVAGLLLFAAAPRAQGQMSDLSGLDREFEEVVGRVAPAVVAVDPGGSGVCVSEDGFILTGGVVARALARARAHSAVVTFPGRRSFTARIQATDGATNTALLKVEERVHLPWVRPGNPGELQVGHLLMTVGNAFGTAREHQPAVTLGVVSSIRRDGKGRALLFETSAATNPGQDGGPYFNTSGELVGLVRHLPSGLALATVTPIDRIVDAYAGDPSGSHAFARVNKIRPPRDRAQTLSQAFHIAALRARRDLVTIRAARGDGWVTGTLIKGPDGGVYAVAPEGAFTKADDRMEVLLGDGRSVSATVRARDLKARLALLLLHTPREDVLPVARILPQEELRIGQFVVAVGTQKHPTPGADPFVTVGLLSAKHRLDAHLDSLETDAGVNATNAGGVLVDLRGRVLGILLEPSRAFGANSGLGFAMPMDALARVLPDLIAGRDIEPAYLGVELAAPPGGREGGLVAAVLDGFAGDQAGLRPGDLIIRVDDRKISNPEQLNSYLAGFKAAGDELLATILRRRDRLERRVVLTRRP